MTIYILRDKKFPVAGFRTKDAAILALENRCKSQGKDVHYYSDYYVNGLWARSVDWTISLSFVEVED